MGEAYIDKKDPRRDKFEERFASLWEGLVQYLPLDAAVDQVRIGGGLGAGVQRGPGREGVEGGVNAIIQGTRDLP
jgi:hypothetical protein